MKETSVKEERKANEMKEDNKERRVEGSSVEEKKEEKVNKL